MENKQLQISKDNIAKNFNHLDWENLCIHYQEIEKSISDEIIESIAIEYHRLMSEEKESQNKRDICKSYNSLEDNFDI